MKFQAGDKVTVKDKPEYHTRYFSNYTVVSSRNFITEEWVQLTPNNGINMFWVREMDCIPIIEDEEETEHWLDSYGMDIFGESPIHRAKRLKCDCGAAAVGGIPHFKWCAIAHLEEVAKKRESRNEFD